MIWLSQLFSSCKSDPRVLEEPPLKGDLLEIIGHRYLHALLQCRLELAYSPLSRDATLTVADPSNIFVQKLADLDQLDRFTLGILVSPKRQEQLFNCLRCMLFLCFNSPRYEEALWQLAPGSFVCFSCLRLLKEIIAPCGHNLCTSCIKGLCFLGCTDYCPLCDLSDRALEQYRGGPKVTMLSPINNPLFRLYSEFCQLLAGAKKETAADYFRIV